MIDDTWMWLVKYCKMSSGQAVCWISSVGDFSLHLKCKKGQLLAGYKETRSQTLVLISLLKYDQAAGKPQFAQQEQQLVSVLTDQFYQHTYHGYFYRVTPDFKVYVDKPGQGIGVEDFFTTEAMGSSLDALQQTEFA